VSGETTEERHPTERDILRDRHDQQEAAILRVTLTPREIAERIRRDIVGQDDTVETLASALHTHLLAFRLDARDALLGDLPKQVTCLIGPSGSGKTAVVRSLAALSLLPFHIADMTQLTESGWQGTSVDDLVATLIERAWCSLRLAAWGILALDELDKTRTVPMSVRDISGIGAQQSLLRLADDHGELYLHSTVNSQGQSRRYSGPFPVDHLFVVAAGVFDGLDEIVARRVHGRRSIGFGTPSGDPRDDAERRADLMSQVTHEDLVDFGLIEELVNRVTTLCVLRPLSRESLKHILRDVPGGPVRSLQRTAQAMGFTLRWTPALLDAVVEESTRTGQAARGLSTIAHRVCRRVMYEVPDRIGGTRTQTAIVTLGVDAMRDGSYRLEWRAATPARGSVRRLVMDDAGGEGDGTQSGAG
jgi:ATP-dependent Clp protease ATP-binding subunit ClpX